MNKELKIPELSLVTLIGVSGSGKSTFARKHFKDTEIVSSDRCRAIVSDDENRQNATDDAFELLHYIAAKRLKNGLLTVVDATNVQPESRASLISLAKEYHCIPVAIVLDLPERICEERNKTRNDRNFGRHVIYQQRSQLKRSLRHLKSEGFRHIHVLRSPEEIDAITNIAREKLYNDKKEVRGPFDIIGDIHGCYDELVELLTTLGYVVNRVEEQNKNYGFDVVPLAGRTAVFLGDLVDRGPNSPDVLRLVMSMVRAGTAYCVPGNHDLKLQKYLDGKDVQIKHGMQKTVEQLTREDDRFKSELKDFLYALVSHYVFDGGRLVVAHAGLKEEMQGRGSGAVRSFCLYGETTGEIDEFGLPVRYNWALEYRGKAMVVYGHTPVPEAQWLNRTIDIDTGCVFGGKLTALRYPEEQLVSVPARKVYETPARPIDFEQQQTKLTAQQEHDDLLDLDDVTGKRIISTRLRNNVTVKEENSIAALEVMSRFAINPKWLIYLPPTMSPSETSERDGYLEHPVEVLQYFRSQGVKKVICEEKHMGSRAVLVIGKDEEAVRRRFGIDGGGIDALYASIKSSSTDRDLQMSSVGGDASQDVFGSAFRVPGGPSEALHKSEDESRAPLELSDVVLGAQGTQPGALHMPSAAWRTPLGVCYTRTGRNFFNDDELERAFIARVNAALTKSGFWETMNTDWVCLDAELMPWSVKAQVLLKDQYASVGAAATASLHDVVGVLQQTTSRNIEGIDQLLAKFSDKQKMIADYRNAYGHYCWPVNSVDDLTLAPFHILATESAVHVDKDHGWHMQTIKTICDADPKLFLATTHKVIDVLDEDQVNEVVTWWTSLTDYGGEGMVIKPYDFVAVGKKGLVQPAVKCRGREYLRIIYGPEYSDEENMARLRNRGLSGKRSLALREFALGAEGLERFVRKEPLRKVHECVFGVLALESEEVDPRL